MIYVEHRHDDVSFQLGQIVGRLDEIRQQQATSAGALQRLEEKMEKRIVDHEGRLRLVEIRSAMYGAIAGGAGGGIVAELIRIVQRMVH
jgi:hypothetical protein